MHKSIFVKVKDYKSDPVCEFKKIKNFISKAICYQNHYTIWHLFLDCFPYCKSLRSNYINFGDCIDKNTTELQKYNEQKNFETLPEEVQDELLDEFLTFSEIIACMYRVTYYNFFNNHPRYELENNIFEQGIEMLASSLKSINYEFKYRSDNRNDEVVDVIKINPEAEYVASQTKPTLRQAIISYLGARDTDIGDKELKLHAIIDLIEPLLKKYSNENKIGSVKQYSQLIRHPEIYRKEPKYSWFFKNKKKYLDYIFDMCIYVIEYDVVKKNLDDFNHMTPNEN